MKTLTNIVITEGQFYLIMAGFVIWSIGMFILGHLAGVRDRKKEREVSTWINGSTINAQWPRK